MYIGITCGLSAPFIGAQIDWILDQEQQEKFVSVLMGFNPISVARNVPVENWNKTVYQVVQRLHQASTTGTKNSRDSKKNLGNHFILNPVYGPEPISGSTRMKGGTITKVSLC